MKTLKKKIILFLLVALTGLALLIVNIIKGDNNIYVNGFASGIIAVSLLKTGQFIRIAKNPAMLRQFTINQKEERLIMLAQKSGRITFIISLIAELLAVTGLIFINKSDIAMIIAYFAGLQSFLYLIVYCWLAKKY